MSNMKVYTIVSSLTERTYERDINNRIIRNDGWEPNPFVDEELNSFLRKNGERVISMETHINTIHRHNNNGFDILVKTTTILLKGENDV